MAGETINVKIDPLGRATIEANGFTGTSCETATQGIEKALSGGKLEATKVIKPEWNETESAENHQTQTW